MSATVLVAYQWAATTAGATVAADGTVDLSRATPGLSEYDQVAIELARGLADAVGARLVAVGVGGQAVSSGLATKGVASRGPDELVVVRDEAPSTTSVAAALAQVARTEPDVVAVVTGEASGDHGTRMVPGLLAGLLGWPLLAETTRVEPTDGGLRAVHARPGARETVQVTGPAVVAAAPDAVRPRVPGMRDILGAAKKPVRAVAGPQVPPSPARVLEAIRVAPPSRGGRTVPADDPGAAAQRLLGELRTAGVL